MATTCQSNHLREKQGTKATTLQRPAPATEGSIRELESGSATASPAAAATNNSAKRAQQETQRKEKHISGLGTVMASGQCSRCGRVGHDAEHCPFFRRSREAHADAQLGDNVQTLLTSSVFTICKVSSPTFLQDFVFVASTCAG